MPKFHHLFLLLVYLIAVNNAHAQGHGLCNNSAGFRIVKHYVDNKDTLVSQYLSARLASGEELSSNEKALFLQVYSRMMDESARSILEASEPQLLSRNGLSQGVLYSRNNALTMDYVISFGVEPDFAYQELLAQQDAALNPIALAENGIYAADLRTGGELVRSGARALRWNGAELPPAVRDYFAADAVGGQNLDRLSIVELRENMQELLPAGDLNLLEETQTLEDAFAHLNEIEIGDSALISFNTQFRLQDQSLTSPRRFTVFLQKVTEERIFIYDPMAGQLSSQDLDSILTITTSGEPGTLRNRLSQFHFTLFSAHANQLNQAIRSGSEEEQYLARLLMRDIYGIDATDPPAQIIFEDFTTITHKPPPA